MMMNKINNTDDRGVVSLLVCFIMMIVITLIAIGFAQLSVNEQKSALNGQLSEVAYYAADSGINYATSLIAQGNTSSQLTCSGVYSKSNSLSKVYDVSYPCVTVNQVPTSLQYKIGAGRAQAVNIISNTGFISNIKLDWFEDKPITSSTPPFSSCQSNSPPLTFVPSDAYTCAASILQVDVVDGSSSSSLLKEATVMYLYPTASGSGTSDIVSGIQKAACNNIFGCSYTIKIATPISSHYYLRILPLYGSTTSLSVHATDVMNNPIQFINAQADITSTGRAQNVVQSLKAFVDISRLPNAPAFAIQSYQNICAEQQGGGGTPPGVRGSSCSTPPYNEN